MKSILVLIGLLLILPFTSNAQEENESFILSLTEFTVKFGQDANFTDGVKKWNKCYKENNGKDSWNVWHRLQGKGNVYVLASRMNTWAEMDNSDAAARACRPVAMNFIMPHIESTEYNTTRSMPKISKKANLGDMTIVWVTSFVVNDQMAFNEVVDEVSSTIAKKEGDRRGYWYRYMGGEGADYFVSTPFKDFADLDKDMAGVWEVYESVHGKTKTMDIRKKFNKSLDDVWSYTYTLEKELSMQQ
ncbi:hypothetical protein AB9K26_06845 [Psychroserpens sp. XS_ASV72]|uniref:hypothetical protein n=1 Tax=Psychroserpens sp. XS_ASV72 TaxID=3241293 RepID=UPI003513540C